MTHAHDKDTCSMPGCTAPSYAAEAKARQREMYTWQDAARDLAMSTRLTISQTAVLVHHLERQGNGHPFDVVPAIVWLENATDPLDHVQALAGLLALFGEEEISDPVLG